MQCDAHSIGYIIIYSGVMNLFFLIAENND